MDHHLLPVEKHHAANAHNAGGDFLDFLHQGDAQPDARALTLERVIGMDRNMDNGDFFDGSTEEDDDADRLAGGAFAVVGEQGLGLVIAHAHGKPIGRFLQARVAELFERFNNAFTHDMLAGIEKEQLLQCRAARFFGA